MDLMRRAASGELAELLGSPLLDTDKRFRMHGFRQIAQQIVEDAPAGRSRDARRLCGRRERRTRDLSARPWEYLVLRNAAEYVAARGFPAGRILDVSQSQRLDRRGGTCAVAACATRCRRKCLRFFYPLGTEWDAPIAGGVWRVPPIPPARDLRFASIARRITA